MGCLVPENENDWKRIHYRMISFLSDEYIVVCNFGILNIGPPWDTNRNETGWVSGMQQLVKMQYLTMWLIRIVILVCL